MNILRLLLSCMLLLAGCATAPPSASLPPAPVILVAIDGFRPDYLDRGVTPNMSRLAAEGVRAQGMRPSFPSLTFPNHYTLVTGMRPDRHGIVNNVMTDPDHPGVVFTLGDRAVNTQPYWWNDAAPLWVSAEKQGVRTATMFWPGSEVEIRGTRPHDWLTFDQAMPSAARVDRVLAWLDRPPAERPRFITLYFDIVDTAGHLSGPDSPELNAAAHEVDAAMGKLVDGLAARGLANANIVVVADHGMAPVSVERVVDLDAVIAPALVRYVWAPGPIAGVEPAAGQAESAVAPLLGRHGHAECWKRGEMPARLHFGSHRRVPAVVCLADTGWTMVSTGSPRRYPIRGGAHGYDPEDPQMAALFIAHGPAFRAGSTVPTFDNVNVYPLLAGLIGVTPDANDGDPAVLAGALK
ncbi:MAG: alkaline phosphatase family protein [Hyphomonadaceae bacterium]|nr:MAG: nucleotide pyrophosphatase family protein [Caulobacteraceae bacterium]MBT9445950.1 alkaline phosphatase family protein [Hyphomonadaceae bacterium]TPW08070.1 MAG: nucleotide pyrophosphatase family protein [Alphaproteobacteria bacterium]